MTNKPVLNHCRHAGPTSQIPYNRESDIANSALQNALIGDVKTEILSIAPVDTELSVLKGHIVELKKENDLLRNQLKHKNQCIIVNINFYLIIYIYIIFSFFMVLFTITFFGLKIYIYIPVPRYLIMW